MSSSFEKSVKGATKAAPPKTKYIEHILIATHSGEHGVAEVFRSLQVRIRDYTWTVVLKSLITVHLMVREGSQDVTLAYLADHKNSLATSSFTDITALTMHGQVQTQGRNIRHYADYLMERARAYRETHVDWVRGAEHLLEKLAVDKGLLRQTEIVQDQITALLECEVVNHEPENEITITIFRLLVLDLLALFNVMNEAMINILGHFFEMSKSDAERAMDIYRNFTKQTDSVVAYLGTAREFEQQTRVQVPKLKHAPVNLGKQLEDYLSDPDFEINRRQYLAEQDIKKGKSGVSGPSSLSATPSKIDGSVRATAGRGQSQPAVKNSQPVKGPDPDLIDFFDSIEQNQQPMATQSSAPQQMTMPNLTGTIPFQQQQQLFQQNGFTGQQIGFQNPSQYQQLPFNNGFQQPQQDHGQPPQQLSTNFTGAGFGGYTPQPAFQPTSLSPVPQDSVATFQSQGMQPFGSVAAGQQQTTNPFRQSMMVASQTGSTFEASSAQPIANTPQSTNPFSKGILAQPTQTASFPAQHSQETTAPMQLMRTGTNPFARTLSPPISQSPPIAGQLMPQPTGSTNPFRQSAFVNTATGSGWQNNQQPIGGGLDLLETVPVFPRPAQQQPWQQ